MVSDEISRQEEYAEDNIYDASPPPEPGSIARRTSSTTNSISMDWQVLQVALKPIQCKKSPHKFKSTSGNYSKKNGGGGKIMQKGIFGTESASIQAAAKTCRDFGMNEESTVLILLAPAITSELARENHEKAKTKFCKLESKLKRLSAIFDED
ncbi:uncharacterized protein RAG0_15100 [Rhynchosporium agropyri]|uniref:Uncharacterized protein n=1 Tax=Rhynchosporium agropyri TaxID=914238 RepID=A0A1E1LJK6_9HELO|nr:uncharacterized protein RAG0_15100 [Rhynchosporium agropyri]